MRFRIEKKKNGSIEIQLSTGGEILEPVRFTEKEIDSIIAVLQQAKTATALVIDMTFGE